MGWLDMLDVFLAVLLLGVMSIRGRRRHCLQGELRAQTISCVLTTLLSSMYALIIAFAFVAFRVPGAG
jgi:hypothetical protein